MFLHNDYFLAMIDITPLFFPPVDLHSGLAYLFLSSGGPQIESSLMETKKELLQHFSDLEETSRIIEEKKQSLRKKKEDL